MDGEGREEKRPGPLMMMKASYFVAGQNQNQNIHPLSSVHPNIHLIQSIHPSIQTSNPFIHPTIQFIPSHSPHQSPFPRGQTCVCVCVCMCMSPIHNPILYFSQHNPPTALPPAPSAHLHIEFPPPRSGLVPLLLACTVILLSCSSYSSYPT